MGTKDQLIFGERDGCCRRLHSRWLGLNWWQRSVFILLSLVLLGVLIAIILLIVVLIRAGSATTPTSNFSILNNAKTEGIEDGKYVERARRLAEALKIETTSYEFDVQEYENILKLHDFLRLSFPLVYSSDFIKIETVNTYSLLYTVTGSANRDKLPYLLASHLDVVPANPDTWEVHPFSGEIVNKTFIYGRGVFDDKGGVLGILESLEYMLSKNDRPLRTFYIAFGHDEEISGRRGAQEIVKTLERRGVTKLDFMLDEGLYVNDGTLPGTKKPIGLIGVTEKGALTLELTVTGEPGHSSFPPWETAIGILAKAVSKLEENKLPSLLGTGPEKYMFEYISPHVDFGHRMLYSNFWLFSGTLAASMEKDVLLNTLVRTTTALTIIEGGVKDNVVPARARAIVNHRIHPSQTVADVIEFDTRVINDPRVTIKILNAREAHPVSPFGPDEIRYQMIAKSIEQTFEDVTVAPGILIANTDTVWYLNLTDHVFRFFPTVLTTEDTLRFHGNNERVTIEMYARSVSFYHRIIKNADLIIDYASSHVENSR